MTDQKKTRRQMLEEFVAKDPNDAFSRYGLALVAVNSGDSGRRDTHFRQFCSKRNADYVAAYLMYAQLLSAESRTDEAKQVLTPASLSHRKRQRPRQNPKWNRSSPNSRNALVAEAFRLVCLRGPRSSDAKTNP